MISDETGPNEQRELLYIDYEVAGYHSVMLDVAKPLYLDIFFEMLYADHIHEASPIEYTLSNGIIEITTGACADRVGREIANIKKRFLIEPIFQLSKDMGCDLEEHVPQLAHALFACACLTRNFSGD